MKKIIPILLAIMFVLALTYMVSSSADFGKIDSQVLSSLEKNGKTRVVVMMKEASSEKSAIKIKTATITKLGSEKIKGDLPSINGFSASINQEDLENLANDANVESILYDYPIKPLLQESVPQINGSVSWGLQSNGINLTGAGQTICLIDTGINYSHSDFGGCANVHNKTHILNGNESNLTGSNLTYRVDINSTIRNSTGSIISYSFETRNITLNDSDNLQNVDKPYKNDTSEIYTLTVPGFSNVALHFVSLETEYSFDYVYVLNSTNGIVATYTGHKYDFWSPSVPGDTIKIKLRSDDSIRLDGFHIDTILNGTANTTETFNWTNCPKILDAWDFNEDDADPMDGYSHGTHVAGIAAANGNIKGVAPDAKLVIVKVFNDAGGGYSSDLWRAIQYCNNLNASLNISVISISAGLVNDSGAEIAFTNYCDTSQNSLNLATYINQAYNKNISVAVATGNDLGTSGITSPACIQNAIPVGSISKSDLLSNYNRNWMVRLLAPGENINSTSIDGTYESMSGTSMATPHVSGAIAIINQYLKATGQTKTPAEIETKLFNTGKQINDSGQSNINYSRIDLYAALLSLDNQAPNITLAYPNNRNFSRNQNQTFRCNATDWQLKNITFYLWNSSNGLRNNTSFDISGTSNESEFNATTLAEGNYTWNCQACDILGNCTYAASNRTVTYDITKPSVTLSSPADGNDSYDDHDSIPFKYVVSDNFEIKNCSLLIEAENVLEWNTTPITQNANNTISYNPANTGARSVSWKVKCYDRAGNYNESSSRTIDIQEYSDGGAGSGDNEAGEFVPFSPEVVEKEEEQGEIVYAMGAYAETEGQNQIFELTPEETKTGYSLEVNEGTRIDFIIEAEVIDDNVSTKINESHSVTVSSIENDSVILIVESEPIEFDLDVGEDKRINVTSPDYYDLYLRLNDINITDDSENANLTIKTIHESNFDLLNMLKNAFDSAKTFGSKYQLIIIAVIVLIIILGINDLIEYSLIKKRLKAVKTKEFSRYESHHIPNKNKNP
jgi:subtilisin family serine protease